MMNFFIDYHIIKLFALLLFILTIYSKCLLYEQNEVRVKLLDFHYFVWHFIS